MVPDLFSFNNGTLELNTPEILLVKEFKALADPKRNKTRLDPKGEKLERAFKEFGYIYLTRNWKSPYAEHTAVDRDEEARIDLGLKESDIDDLVKVAADKYSKLQDSISMQLLTAARRGVEELILHFNEIDLQERDQETNKPIHKSNDLIGNLANLGKVVDGLDALEMRVKKEREKEKGLRGDAVAGFFD